MPWMKHKQLLSSEALSRIWKLSPLFSYDLNSGYIVLSNEFIYKKFNRIEIITLEDKVLTNRYDENDDLIIFTQSSETKTNIKTLDDVYEYIHIMSSENQLIYHPLKKEINEFLNDVIYEKHPEFIL